MHRRILLMLIGGGLATAALSAAPTRGEGAGATPVNPESIRAHFGMTRATFDRELKRRFQYEPPAPPESVADEAAGRALDAAYLQAFPDLDRAYSPASRAKAKQLAAQLAREAAALTHEQFVLRAAEITALADNAHTTIGEDALRKGTPRLPIRTFLFADGLYVLRATTGQSDLLGARIDAIDGRPIGVVLRSLERYLPGLPERKRLQLIPILESPALLQAAGIGHARDRLSVAGVLASGQRFERTIAAEQRDRSAWVSNSVRLLFPSISDAPMRSFLRPGASAPVYLRSAGSLFAAHALPNRGLYLGLTHNRDGDDEPIAPFLDRALVRVRTERPAFVVVDMRMNGGGDYTTTYEFARSLPAAAAGAPVYVLTSPWTFSAAITTVAALKTHGGSQVTLVGEAVGDRLDFWAEGGTMVLPNSGIQLYYTAGRHNYRGPCTDRAICFWLNEFYPVRVSTLTPDIAAPLTFAAYRAGIDPGLEAILARELARGGRG